MFHAIIQARMGSKRLPGKVLRAYKNLTPLEILCKRLKKIKKISKIIVATTKEKKDDKIVSFCKKLKISYYRGSTNNVLSRYFQAAKKFKSQEIIRLTADNPFIDKNTLIKMVNLKKNNHYHYVANTYPLPCSYPDGSDIEIFDYETLKKTNKLAKLPSEKEHVTFYMWQSKKFLKKRINLRKNLSKIRYTIDTLDDFKLFTFIIDEISKKKIFSANMHKIVRVLLKNKKKTLYQKKLDRSAGWRPSFKKDKIFKKKLR
jgi:spore coat polysaccharide biosynthesis protein SpsF